MDEITTGVLVGRFARPYDFRGRDGDRVTGTEYCCWVQGELFSKPKAVFIKDPANWEIIEACEHFATVSIPVVLHSKNNEVVRRDVGRVEVG